MALVHLSALSGAVERCSGASQSPSPVLQAVQHGRLQWAAAPQLSSRFSQCAGVGVPRYHCQPPPGCFWGAVGGGGERAELPELAVTPRPHCLLPGWTLEPSSG